MSDRLLSITIRGRTKEWSFNFRGDPRYLHEWRADGLVVEEIFNRIPQIIVDLGLTKVWIWLQDNHLLPS